MEKPANKKPNRLIKEKSPYLLQHAYNPVDWYPWSAEAFHRAEVENKPLFVSIGYSTCHWCHVMEKESFEDEQVAALMNKSFICIKVDREERPDLDSAYMAVCQAMGRNCGWPLNVIMTPQKNPFFIASYIPKENRYGAVGMLSLVPQIEQIYNTRRSEMEKIGIELKEQITIKPRVENEKALGAQELNEAFDQMFLAFDHENAGFGHVPKFPAPHYLLFLMRYFNRTKEKTAWNMVERTLRAMRLGGIFDQVGLGFHRYSTDARWLVPHFEKMLYDQAMLALAYTEGYQLSGQLKFRVTAKETLDYVLRDLVAIEGGFYSAEDADSEGEEGKFYLWTQQEIKQVLPSELLDFAIKIFGVQAQGNYVEPNMQKSGKNILHLSVPLEQIASETNLTVDQVIGKLGKIVNLLFQAREKRVHPAKDDKILVDWNGLTIAAMAMASQVFGEKSYLIAAEKAADFILSQMQTEDGKLFHRYAKGEKAICGFLDDYAFFIWGLIELFQADFKKKYLEAAILLTKTMIAEFWDIDSGGFGFTDSSGDKAVPNIKQIYDGAIPSGNSVALLDLLRIARLSGDVSFEQTAQKLLDSFAEDIKGYPMGHTYMLVGLDFAIGPTFSIVLVGNKESEDMKEMLSEIRKNYLPNLTVKIWEDQDNQTTIPGVNYEKINGKATAYVCQNQTCMPPTTEKHEMLKYLGISATPE